MTKAIMLKTIKSCFALVIFMVAFVAGGCATKVPTTGDKMLTHSKDASELADRWTEGLKDIENGRELMDEGQTQIEKAQKDLKEGLEKIKEGDEKRAEGVKLIRAAEKEFKKKFPDAKLQ
jgi:hypothetical protein